MEKNARIFVAGHRGLVGSAIVRRLHAAGYTNLLMRTHTELDLTDQQRVREFFQCEKPEHVILAAAKVGGILANNTYPGEFIHENLAIQTNIIHEAWRVGITNLLFLGSSCIYPRECPQPIREQYILTSPLEPTNQPYALAKIAGVEMCSAYNRQYGTRYIAAMPTNLYGPNDSYDLNNSHVLPALIRKTHEAKVKGDPTITVWGSGNPRREFLHSDDLADAVLHLLQMSKENFARVFPEGQLPLINIGCGEDMAIADLAQLVRRVVGFDGELIFDHSKPDGTPRKILDVSRMASLGWQPRIALEDGIRLAYADFMARYPDARAS